MKLILNFYDAIYRVGLIVALSMDQMQKDFAPIPKAGLEIGKVILDAIAAGFIIFAAPVFNMGKFELKEQEVSLTKYSFAICSFQELTILQTSSGWAWHCKGLG